MISRLMWPFIVLQVTAVIAIIFFLRTLLHRQLELGMKRIRRLDQENVRKKAELSEKIDQLNKEYNQKIGKAEMEARIIIEAAREEARSMREEERNKAKEEVKKIISAAIQQKEKLIKDVQRKAFDEGLDIASRILKRIFSEDDLKGLRQKVSREVMDALASSKEVKELTKKNDEFEIITAEAMSDDDKKYAANIFKDSPGKKMIKFTVDKKTLGGLILKTGEEIIEGSVAYRIRKAAAEIREKGIG